MVLDTYKRLIKVFRGALKKRGYKLKKQGDTFIFRKKHVTIVFFRDSRYGESPLEVYFVTAGLLNEKINANQDMSYKIYKRLINKIKEYEPQEF